MIDNTSKTTSLCPLCLSTVPADIVVKDNRVYFQKHCPTHGMREDFVCSDASYFDRLEYLTPPKMPRFVGIEASEKQCPYDCGLCNEHLQHTCIGLVELTSSCNLKCPMCYASSGPGGQHLSLEDCKKCIDRFVQVEYRAEVLQLSGGEPTIHPQFAEVLEYACSQPIEIVMINTNGIRIAQDPAFVELLDLFKHRIEVYLQFDGFCEQTNELLRGESLLDRKLKAIEILGKHKIRTILVTTLQTNVNQDQIEPIVEFAMQRPWITGTSFQPATYCGRHMLPEQLERRITFPDIVKTIAAAGSNPFITDDFMPLPCAHPNMHWITYAFRNGDTVVPLMRFIDAHNHLDLLAGGITFNRKMARDLIERYLGKLGCCSGNCGPDDQSTSIPSVNEVSVEALEKLLPHLQKHAGSFDPFDLLMQAEQFFDRAIDQSLNPEDVFRITTTSFMDAYNFDVRQLMRSCVQNILPSGHLIPFSAYNTLYREDHVPLPNMEIDSKVAPKSPIIQKPVPQDLVQVSE